MKPPDTDSVDTFKVSSQTNSILVARKKPYENRLQKFKNLTGIDRRELWLRFARMTAEPSLSSSPP
ncbi:hypothetical protein C9I50_26070 [Pseudomonas prosekii]|nr:hypothetical protein C9I50_26070 [Pseudomonas prosekii]